MLITKWNLAFHQADALEFFTAFGMIKIAVLELTSNEVWKSALADRNFIAASKKRIEEFEAGLATVVSPEDL